MTSKKTIAAPLDNAKKKHYRTLGHDLKPVVTLSENGLSEGVAAELERALEDHELIKIKINYAEPAKRKLASQEICELTGSQLVQNIGKVALLYRPAKKPNPKLSNLLRL